MTRASLRSRLQRLENPQGKKNKRQPRLPWDWLASSPEQAAAYGSDWADLDPRIKAALAQFPPGPVEDSIERALQEEIARLDRFVKDTTPADDPERGAG